MSPKQRVRCFLTGAVLSIFGSSVSAVALPIYVLETFNQPELLGLLLLAREVPVVVLSPWLGVHIDRIGAYRTAVTALLLSAGAVGLVPLVGGQKLLLVGLMVLLGTGLLLLSPVVSMYLQALVDPPARTRMNARFNVAATIGGLLGTALAGLLLDRGWAWAAFAVDAATYLAGLGTILIVGRIVPPETFAAPGAGGLRAAVRRVARQTVLLPVVVADLGLWTAVGVAQVGLPVYALEVLRQRGGLLYSVAMGIGTIGEFTGALLAPAAARHLSTSRYIGLAGALGGLYLLVGTLEAIPVLLVVVFALSALMAVLSVWYETLVQDVVPGTMMGRFKALLAGLSSALGGFGSAAGGALARRGGSLAYLAAGATALVMAAVAQLTKLATVRATHAPNLDQR